MSAAKKPRNRRRASNVAPKRGKWLCGKWYPRWRLEEIREKYRDPPDVDLGGPERAP